MAKKLTILVLVFSVSACGSTAAFGARSAHQTALRDGFFLDGVDGKLTNICADSNKVPQSPGSSADAGKRWFFKLDSDLSSDRCQIQAGSAIEVLPSATLEKMLANKKHHPEASYRLWGNVTKYEDKNFIFGIYFLPISERTKPASSATKETSTPTSTISINDPGDAITIPEDLLKKLKTRKIVRTGQLQKGIQLKQDLILADRIGFIVKQDDELVFVLDALGRNIQRQIPLRLLPCQILEQAQQDQAEELEKLRFKVAGIVTKYKGGHYLLLQRATHLYGHQNFGN